MDFQVGQRLEIAFQDLKCWTNLRGWVPDKVLFVDLPKGARRANLIRKGMQCQVQYVTPEGIRQFQSRVEEVVLNDPPLIYLCFPEEVRTQRLRSELRVRTYFHGIIRTPQGIDIRATVVNLSRGGCLVEMDATNLTPGSQVTVGAILANHLLLVNVPCTVRRVQSPGEAGLKFGALTDEQERNLEHFLRMAAHPEAQLEEAPGTRRGVVGEFKELSLLDVANLVTASGRGYVLDVWDEPRTGRLFFDRGQLVHASVGALRGISAFSEILRWKKGQFFLSIVGDMPHRNVFCEWAEALQQAPASL